MHQDLNFGPNVINTPLNKVESDSTVVRVEENNSLLQYNPSFSGRSIKLTDNDAEFDQVSHSNFQDEGGIKPLSSFIVAIEPAVSRSEPINRNQVESTDTHPYFDLNEALEDPHKIIMASSSLVDSSQENVSESIKSEEHKKTDITTVRSHKGQNLWLNALQIIKAKKIQNTLRLERIDEEDPDPIITDKSPSPDQEGSIPTGPPRFSRINHQFSLHPHEVVGTGNWTKDNPVIAARSISRNVYYVAKPLAAFGENELAILNALQHDMHENIANYLGTETDKSGKKYVILQQGGESLGNLIRRGGMSLELIDKYIFQLVNIVDYLNSRKFSKTAGRTTRKMT